MIYRLNEAERDGLWNATGGWSHGVQEAYDANVASLEHAADLLEQASELIKDGECSDAAVSLIDSIVAFLKEDEDLPDSGHKYSYNRGYLDGGNDAIKELQHGQAQDNRLADLYQQALALGAQLTATRAKEQLLLDDERDAHADTRLELQKANDRLVEYKQRIARSVAELEMPVQCPLRTESPEAWAWAREFCCVVGDGAHYLEPGTVIDWLGKVPLCVLRALLATQGLTIVSEKDRSVLDICSAMKLSDDDPDADPMEPQEHGEDCYIYTDDQRDIARAELARREKP